MFSKAFPNKVSKSAVIRPSIWLAEFSTGGSWQAISEGFSKSTFPFIDEIDSRLVVSRHPHTVPAYCSFCDATVLIEVYWHFSSTDGRGTISLPWTETYSCPHCKVNSRCRALFSFVRDKLQVRGDERVYIAERVTPAFDVFRKYFPSIIGSEYLGPTLSPGEEAAFGENMVRHEDLTKLSFDNGSLDLVMTQALFEHVPDYSKAFRECSRVLSSEGHLVFNIPFHAQKQQTIVRAEVLADGSIKHHLPPEYHGDPVNAEGGLCYQDFGWDMLDCLRAAGFKKASGHLYWGPWEAHLGAPLFIFCASKASM